MLIVFGKYYRKEIQKRRRDFGGWRSERGGVKFGDLLRREHLQSYFQCF